MSYVCEKNVYEMTHHNNCVRNDFVETRLKLILTMASSLQV